VKLPAVAAVIAALAIAASCNAFRREALPPAAMPAIPVYEIVPRVEGDSGMTIVLAPARDPLRELGATKRISLTANNADAKTLLLWLAQESGVSVVIAPDVSARVSVSFTDVPAAEAMRAIISEAGLSLLASGLRSPWPPVVFHRAPMNIDQASVDAIVARFGVSLEMAKWIVESRTKP
jgi:hypothetical protein